MQISSVAIKPQGATATEGERNFVQSSNAQTIPAKSTAEKPVIEQSSRSAPQVNAQEKRKLEDGNLRSNNIKEPSQDAQNSALKQVNDAFTKNGANLQATIEKDKDTGINVLKFTDRETKEVIRQFPSKAVIAMAQAIGESLDTKGQLISERA